jgi:hypothetical protein
MAIWEERNSDHLSVNVVINDELAAIIKKRTLLSEEIQFAIYHAEQENDRAYDAANPKRCLVKHIVGKGLYHVDYTIAEDSGKKVYNINDCYACYTKIK